MKKLPTDAVARVSEFLDGLDCWALRLASRSMKSDGRFFRPRTAVASRRWMKKEPLALHGAMCTFQTIQILDTVRVALPGRP